jgi:GT2 family glycosyltransferase
VISVIVVDFRGGELLRRCVRDVHTALERVDGGGELIVVDNGSAGGLALDGARVIELSTNRGFAGGVAVGLEHSHGEWVALVNNDAFLERDALARMLAAGSSDERIGAVTAQVRFERRPDLVNTAGLEIDRLGIAYDRLAGVSVTEGGSEPVEVFGASACVTLYRRAMLDEIGGFDTSFFAFGEDADVAWRARMAGWRCLYEPRAIALHRGSMTARERSVTKYFLVGRNRVRLLAKNATTDQLVRHGLGMIAYDLAYVAFAAATDRTLAPLRGRVRGLREWRAYRSAGAALRRPVALGRGGWRGALRMRNAYRAAP